jgi:thymidylate kinase
MTKTSFDKCLIYVSGPLLDSTETTLAHYTDIANWCAECGFTPYLPHLQTAHPQRQTSPRLVHGKNFAAISESCAVIADISTPSHGVGIELAYADFQGIPTICLLQTHTSISKMVLGLNHAPQIINYSSATNLRTQLKQCLSKLRPQHYCIASSEGRLFSIEGIDGTFKSSLAKRLMQELNDVGLTTLVTSDPPQLNPWDHFSEIFQIGKNIDPVSEAYLLLASRIDNFRRVVRPALDNRTIVILDRYVDSWLAYQSLRLQNIFGSKEAALSWLCGEQGLLAARGLVPWPALTFLMIDNPDNSVLRVKKRGAVSKYDQIDFQTKVQHQYLALAGMYPERMVKVELGNNGFDVALRKMKESIIQALVLTD